MLFVIDLDTLQVIKAATDKSPVVSVEGKRGDDTPFEVVFVRTGIAEELAASSVLTFGAKQAGKYDAAAVVLNSDFTLSGSGTTAKYTASPSFNTAGLNALFLIDADDSNDPAYVDLMAEFTWQVGSGPPSSSKTFGFRVHNDVVRDDEFSPTPAYSPIGSTAPTNGSDTLTITGITSPADSDPIVLTPTETPYEWAISDTWVVYLFEGTWVVDGLAGAYQATKTAGSELTPVGLTGWTLVNGTGQPIITAAGDATLAPPYLRVSGGFLYVQEAGVWKKTALSAL